VHLVQEPLKDQELARELWDKLASSVSRVIALWKDGRSVRDVGEVEEVWVGAELLKHANGDERVGARLFDGVSNFFGLGDELVEFDLEWRRSAKDDVLVLDRHCAREELVN
jgi:hypothetical protein